MKKTISILVFIAIAYISAFAAESIFQSFVASSGANSVTLEWRTSSESGINKFEIERSSENVGFTKIADENAKGFATQYKYIDSDAMMKADIASEKVQNQTLSGNTYSYRLKAIYSNGNYVYSDEVKVSQTINSIRRTWGMIKEMFR